MQNTSETKRKLEGMGYTIPLFGLNFDGSEADAAAEAIRSGWISMGQRTAAFEEAFARKMGVGYAVAVSNGTAALHLALALLLQPGDEVIVPSLTFVATANAIRYVGAQPVFADIVGPWDLTMDPEDVRRKVTTRTRAILPMHYGGFACNMDALTTLTASAGLHLVEDAAHAPLVSIGGKALGTFGACGCFSFFSNKNLTCAEGGMVVTDDQSLAERARRMRSHGMTTLSYDRAKGHATRYDVIELGYNYRLDDIRAAIGLVQLSKVEKDRAARKKVRTWYEDRLRDIPGIHVPFVGEGRPSSHYIMPVVIAKGGSARRDSVRQALARCGIETSVHYPAVHRFSIYQREEASPLPQTEYVADHEITLPMHASLSEGDVETICTALGKALEK